MLTRIMRHEWRLLKADRTALVVAGLFMLAVGYAVFDGADRVRQEQAALDRYIAAHEALVERYRERAEAIERVEAGGSAGSVRLHKNEFTWGPRQPAYVPAWALFFAALPPSHSSLLAIGQSDIYPPVLTVRPTDRELLSAVEPNGNPLKLFIGHFDLAFVVLFLYPLFILALSFDLLASEREQGTLALLCSQPVSMNTLLFGKVAARALITVATTVICASVGFLLTGTAGAGPDTALRLFFWFVAVGLYGAFWFGLAVWVNSWGGGSMFNALAAVSCWLLVTFLVPALLVITAERLYPLPPRAESVAVRRAAEFEANERRSRMTLEEHEALISGFIKENPELQESGAWNEKGKASLFSTAQRHATSHQIAPQRQRVTEQRKRQAAFVGRLSVLSPALLVQSALYDLAGTGPERREHFIKEAERYQREFERFLWPRIFTGTTISSNELKNIPRFKYREEPSSAVAWRTAVPMTGLMCLGAFFWLAGMRRFRNGAGAEAVGHGKA